LAGDSGVSLDWTMTPLINSCCSASTRSARSLAAKKHAFERRSQCRPSVDDVEERDLWYFPAGLPHSLQGLGPDGASSSPLTVLVKKLRRAQRGLQQHSAQKSLDFPGREPGDREADRAAARVQPNTEPVVFRLSRFKRNLAAPQRAEWTQCTSTRLRK
jgi:hypothetical protein